MNSKTRIMQVLLCIFSLILIQTDAISDEVFSIDRASGSSFDPGDVLVPSPTIIIHDFDLGFSGALAGIEIDGISSGRDNGTELLFSVDALSTGREDTDVFLEYLGGPNGSDDHPADIFRNPLLHPGANYIYRDGDGTINPLSAPEFGLREPYAVAMDNTDAYDAGPICMPNYSGPIYFTVGLAAPGNFLTDTIYLVPFPGSPVIPYVLGFTMCLTLEDDIDAIFVVDDGDMAFNGTDVIGFSLSRSSRSLEAGSNLSNKYAAGAALSPADVFIQTAAGGTFLVPASTHGLRFDDNVDALDQVPEITDDFVLGDVNGDGVVNLLDVSPFVELISSGEFLKEADINGDGSVNLLDVDPFIELLNG